MLQNLNKLITATFLLCINPRSLKICAYFLFFLMLFLPTTQQFLKAIILAIILTAIICIALLQKYINLHPYVFSIVLFLSIIGLFFTFLGVLNANPGALKVAKVYVIWPLVFCVLAAGASKQDVIKGIFRTMVFATWAIGIFTLIYLFHSFGLFPECIYFEFAQGQAIGIHEGYIEYNLFSISSLLFLVPFHFIALMVWPKESKAPVHRISLWIAFWIGFLLVLLSGRRALQLVVFIAPLIFLLVRIFSGYEFKKATLHTTKSTLFIGITGLICLFFLCNFIFNIEIGGLFRNFINGFNFQGDPSGYARFEQFVSLITDISKHPILGYGHGAISSQSIRSIKQPWTYELSYLALIFHTGIIGFLLYFIGFSWILTMGIKIIRSEHWLAYYMMPALTGMISFLIGNATNPYLEKFDYMWVIFLPIILINYWLLLPQKKRGA